MNMKCSNCGNSNATTHIKQNINGQVSEAYLCPECAEKAGVGGMFSGFGSFGFGGFSPFGSLLGSFFDEGFSPRSIAPSKRCGICGSSFSEIAERGQVGCSQCYDTFSGELAPSIERIHGRTSHTGKQPGGCSSSDKTPDKTSELELLRKQMDEAVKKQEYEQAAVLRDKIRELEANLNG
ncbi:MAG: hypothetical protein E7546_06090 [Ruminococcaceae bacterium]|nr:hypothetical protein [Oscillospiraceae bacterium]